MADFSEADLRALYAQHTEATGQVFTEEALVRAWEYTAGQPWLVNALAAEVVDWMAVPAGEPVTAEHIDTAKERLIRARATHLDSLLARLHEPRVRRILEPLIAGDVLTPDPDLDEDVAYVHDLGLIAQGLPVRVANPIYREVIVRVLGTATEANITAEPRSFVLPDGRLDFDRLLHEFAAFWRANGDILTSGKAYHEVAPQLVIMAYLSRLINGGGFVDREYGVGRGRVDLLVRWPHRDQDGKRAVQRQALELKVWRKGRGRSAGRGPGTARRVPVPPRPRPGHPRHLRPPPGCSTHRRTHTLRYRRNPQRAVGHPVACLTLRSGYRTVCVRRSSLLA